MTLDQNQVRKVFLEGLRFCKWLLYSGATGLLVGAVAAAFHLGIDWGAELRGEHPWILYFLPLGGIAIVLLYRLSGMEKDQGTNLVLIAVRGGRAHAPAHRPTDLRGHHSHPPGGGLRRAGGGGPPAGGLPGGLAGPGGTFGRQGPAGDGHVRHVRRLLRPVRHPPHRHAVLHGGGQRGGDVLRGSGALHRIRPHRLPGGPGHGPPPVPRYEIGLEAALGPVTMVQAAALGILCALVSILFCQAVHTAPKVYARFLPNPLLRAAAGGALVLVLTLLVGSQDYNGAGDAVIRRMLAGGRPSRRLFC